MPGKEGGSSSVVVEEELGDEVEIEDGADAVVVDVTEVVNYVEVEIEAVEREEVEVACYCSASSSA